MIELDLEHDGTILVQILEELKKISAQLNALNDNFEKIANQTYPLNNEETLRTEFSKLETIPSSLDILQLQESKPGMFRTYRAIQRMDGWVSSNMIAEKTKRSRGLESRYLNALADAGIVQKKRVKKEPDSRATEVLYRISGGDE